MEMAKTKVENLKYIMKLEMAVDKKYISRYHESGDGNGQIVQNLVDITKIEMAVDKQSRAWQISRNWRYR